MKAGNLPFPALSPESRPRVFGYTLGCRLNACETDAMVASVVNGFNGTQARDFVDADVIIVNTCTVTGRSGARCRKAARGFRARNPRAIIVITGCASQIAPEGFSDLGNCLVLGNNGKESLPLIMSGVPAAEPGEGLFPSGVSPGRRTRAFLKIQDGCDSRCSYCIVPLARGPSRSQPRERVLAQAAELAQMEKREICLVGVDLADYGRDLYGSYRLSDLVRELLSLGGFRIRLSSLEPNFLTVSTLERIALPGLCRHFHIPLQSASTRILKLMGRRYTGGGGEELLARIHQLFPGAAVGADLITGFPGETEADHGQNLSLARSGLLSYLHVFPFSPRPGTPAASMKALHPEVITGRAGELRQVSAEMRNRFRRSMIGSDGLILVEGRKHAGRMVGLTDNYIPVAAPPGSVEGKLTPVTLTADNICWSLR